MSNRSGFTLIEIIVVLIILGILASLAVAQYFTWIENSRTSEAKVMLKNIADKMDACIAGGDSASACINKMGLGTMSTTYFNFAPVVSSNVGNPSFYYIRAERSFLNGPAPYMQTRTYSCPISGTMSIESQNYIGAIGLCRDSDGSRTYTGHGIYQGLS